MRLLENYTTFATKKQYFYGNILNIYILVFIFPINCDIIIFKSINSERSFKWDFSKAIVKSR